MAYALALLVTGIASCGAAHGAAWSPMAAFREAHQPEIIAVGLRDPADLRALKDTRKLTKNLWNQHKDMAFRAQGGTDHPSNDEVLAIMSPDKLAEYNALKAKKDELELKLGSDKETREERRHLQTDDTTTAEYDTGVVEIYNAKSTSATLVHAEATDVCTVGTDMGTVAAGDWLSIADRTWSPSDDYTYVCDTTTSAYDYDWNIFEGKILFGAVYETTYSTVDVELDSADTEYDFDPEDMDVEVFDLTGNSYYVCAGSAYIGTAYSSGWAFTTGSSLSTTYDWDSDPTDVTTLGFSTSSTCSTLVATTDITTTYNSLQMCVITDSAITCKEIYEVTKSNVCDDPTTMTGCEYNDNEYYCCDDTLYPECYSYWGGCAAEGTKKDQKKAADAFVGVLIGIVVGCIVGTLALILACCACCQGCPLYPKLCCAPKAAAGGKPNNQRV